MKSLAEWLDEDKFYIRGHYDPVTDEGGDIGPMVPMGVQPEIFDHVFEEEDGEFPYTTVVWACPKKSGKTTTEAATVSWWAEEYPQPTEIYMIANDEEQTKYRAYSDVAFHFEQRNERPDSPIGHTRVLSNRIVLENGTTIFALAQEYKSAAGSRHSMTAWDELWAYNSERKLRMWTEMAPILIPGVPKRMRIVVTYAGFEDDESPLRTLYDNVVQEGKDGTNRAGGPPAEPVPELEHITDSKGDPVCWRKGRIFVYWDHEHRMPWQLNDEYKEYLQEMRNTKPPGEFLRHHENKWVSTRETFIPIVWWDRAAEKLNQPLLYDSESPYKRYAITLGVDVGFKHDSSAVVGVWHDPKENLTGVAHHKIWKPGGELDFNMEEAIVNHIKTLRHNFSSVKVVADPTNFYGGIVDLKNAGIQIEEFGQSGAKMVAASDHLFQLLKNEALAAYPDEHLRRHMLNTVARHTGQGFRIDKQRSKDNDAVVALAMAAYDAKQNHGVDTSEPLVFESPFADTSEWDEEHKRALQEKGELPPELREFQTGDDKQEAWERLGGEYDEDVMRI